MRNNVKLYPLAMSGRRSVPLQREDNDRFETLMFRIAAILLILLFACSDAECAPVQVSIDSFDVTLPNSEQQSDDEPLVLRHIKMLGFDDALPDEYQPLQLSSHFAMALKDVAVEITSVEEAADNSLPILCVLLQNDRLFAVIADVDASGKRVPIWYASVVQPHFVFEEVRRIELTQAAAASIARKLVHDFKRSARAHADDKRQEPCNKVDMNPQF
jgi:hypothetical protein